MSLEDAVSDQSESHEPFDRFDLSSLASKGLLKPLHWAEQVAKLTVDQDCGDAHTHSDKGRITTIRRDQILDAFKRFKHRICPSSDKTDARVKWSHLAPNRKSAQGYFMRYVDAAHSSRLLAILGSTFGLEIKLSSTTVFPVVDIDSDDEDSLSDHAPSKNRVVRVSIELIEPPSKRHRGRAHERETSQSVDNNNDIHIHIHL